MKNLFTIILILFIVLGNSTYNFAQDSLILETKALLKQLDSGVSPRRGAIIDLVRRYQEDGQQTNLDVFLKELLDLDNSNLTIEGVNEILSVIVYISTPLDENESFKYERKLALRRSLVYDHWLLLQRANLHFAKHYLLSGDLDKAKKLYAEVFLIPYHKLHGEEPFKYSKQLRPMQQEAYLGLLEISSLKKDKSLLRLLATQRYSLIYGSDDYIFESLNKQLEAFGLDEIEKAKRGNIKLEKQR